MFGLAEEADDVADRRLVEESASTRPRYGSMGADLGVSTYLHAADIVKAVVITVMN